MVPVLNGKGPFDKEYEKTEILDILFVLPSGITNFETIEEVWSKGDYSC